MEQQAAGLILRNVFPVIAGVAAAMGCSIVLILFFFANGQLSWGGDTKAEAGQVEHSNILCLVMILSASSFFAGLIVAAVATRKLVAAVVTGILLTVGCLLTGGALSPWVDIPLITVFSLTGGWLISRHRIKTESVSQ
ncbi:MAG: hypothetical protein ABW019_11140 [Chitinophagaceae bacterium]